MRAAIRAAATNLSPRSILQWGVVTTLTCLFIVIAVIAGTALFDRYVDKPRSVTITDAVEQGRQNGYSLCAGLQATDEFVASLVPDGQLTARQRMKRDHMLTVAHACNPTPEGPP